MSSRRVVIAGAGLAGYSLARALDRLVGSKSTPPLQVTLVSPAPCSLLSPLVPASVSGWVAPWQCLVPLGTSLKHVQVRLARVADVDLTAHQVVLDGPGVRSGCEPAQVPFDDLVIATGTRLSYGQAPGVAENVLGLRRLDDALVLRNRLLEALEAASGEDSARRRKVLLTVAVVGSDAKACCAAAEVLHQLRSSARFFARVQPADPRVVLFSPDPVLCPQESAQLSQSVQRQLEKLGVEVRTEAVLQQIQSDHLQARSSQQPDERLEARTVVWTLDKAPSLCVARLRGAPWVEGRLRVDEVLRVVGFEDLYALGDCAQVLHPQTVAVVPSTPGRVVQQAKNLARNLLCKAQGKPLRPVKLTASFDPVLFGAGQGVTVVGSKVLSGPAGALLSRAWLLAQQGLGRQAVGTVASWTVSQPLYPWVGALGRLTPQASQPLYLTAPPPQARSQAEAALPR